MNFGVYGAPPRVPKTGGIHSPYVSFGQSAVEGEFGILFRLRSSENHEAGVAQTTSPLNHDAQLLWRW